MGTSNEGPMTREAVFAPTTPTWNPDDFGEIVTTELKQIAGGGLFVNVDVNDLLDSYEEERVFDILAKLKDLLG
jgi:hypothetical protein